MLVQPLPCLRLHQYVDLHRLEVNNIRLLAFDQSTKVTGFSLWEGKKLTDYGKLDSNVEENNPIERMSKMYFLIKELLNKHNPGFVVLEGVQFQNNYKTYAQLSQMQGVIFSLLFEKDIGFLLIEPTAWRSFCGIKGRKRAEHKAAAIQLVNDTFQIDTDEDTAEAICIGVWASSNIT